MSDSEGAQRRAPGHWQRFPRDSQRACRRPTAYRALSKSNSPPASSIASLSPTYPAGSDELAGLAGYVGGHQRVHSLEVHAHVLLPGDYVLFLAQE
jgi:hypothetical protein